MCAPTSEPFSTTTTEMSGERCLRRMAAESPAGPAPTITTSNSMLSRASDIAMLWDCRHFGVNVPSVRLDLAYHRGMPDIARDQSLSLLRWLIDAGADEATGEQPVDR